MSRHIIRGILVAIAATLLATPAVAKFHLMKIIEVFPGSTAMPNAQYVMLQMYANGQVFVTGHKMLFYNADGGSAGEVPFTATLPNGISQEYVLIATTDAQTFFGIAADLVMPAAISPSGGKVCFDDIDCFSWGNFASSRSDPSPSGTPFGEFGGLSIGHAVRRDVSAGNPALVEKNDDTDDSAADFDCIATADPTNNLDGVSTPYTDASPCPICGNNTLETGEQCDGTDAAACVGACQIDCRCPSDDTVVLPVKPVKVKVSTSSGAGTKTFKVKVRNADAGGLNDSINLVQTNNCPLGVTVTPPNATFALEPRKSFKQVFTVTVNPVFTFASAKAPLRCTITFDANSQTVGNVDPNASNNTAIAELNIFDSEDVVPATHETVIESIKPTTAKIKTVSSSGTKLVKPAVINADLPPDSDSIQLSTALSTCVGLSVIGLDLDSAIAGDQPSTSVDGGKKKKGVVTLSVDSFDFSTPNKLSPARCLLDLEATGPSEPDPMPSNNTTRLIIDVIDNHDL